MSQSLIDKLDVYKGRSISHYIDVIEALAQSKGLSVNVMDPRINNNNSIMTNAMRLNVHTDAEGKITSFTIG